MHDTEKLGILERQIREKSPPKFRSLRSPLFHGDTDCICILFVAGNGCIHYIAPTLKTNITKLNFWATLAL